MSASSGRFGPHGEAQDTVGVSPFHRRDLTLAGFVLSGRWPRTTLEWAQVLLLAVRLAAVPGFVPRTALFRALEQLPDDPEPGTVGMLTCEGPIVGGGTSATPRYEELPPALFVLHPPAETRPSAPQAAGAASGAILLPGLPYLGMSHRAAWVEAGADGTVNRLVSADEVDVRSDPDLAVMASFLAAA